MGFEIGFLSVVRLLLFFFFLLVLVSYGAFFVDLSLLLRFHSTSELSREREDDDESSG